MVFKNKSGTTDFYQIILISPKMTLISICFIIICIAEMGTKKEIKKSVSNLRQISNM